MIEVDRLNLIIDEISDAISQSQDAQKIMELEQETKSLREKIPAYEKESEELKKEIEQLKKPGREIEAEISVEGKEKSMMKSSPGSLTVSVDG